MLIRCVRYCESGELKEQSEVVNFSLQYRCTQRLDGTLKFDNRAKHLHHLRPAGVFVSIASVQLGGLQSTGYSRHGSSIT